MVINKYLLYLITSLLFIIILNIGKIPLVWNGVFVQAHADGNIFRSDGRHTHVHKVIRYEYGDYRYTYYAPSFLSGQDNFLEHWDGKMILNRNKPEEAYIYTFMGLFANQLLIMITVLLIWTFCILAIGFIPMRVKLW